MFTATTPVVKNVASSRDKGANFAWFLTGLIVLIAWGLVSLAVDDEVGRNEVRKSFPQVDVAATPAGAPVWQTAQTSDHERLNSAEQVHGRLTYRYRNPSLIRFSRSLGGSEALRWYQEANGLIDARHLQPTPYERRVKQAATNLWYAVANPAFWDAHGRQPSNQQVAGFREALKQLILGRQIASASDAMNMLQWTMDLGQRHLGLPASSVATEFVYGAAESLDQYSTFTPETTAGRPSATLDDHIVGIGVEVKLDEEGALVVAIVPGTPAADAKLQKGDMIVSVNGQKLAGKSLDATVDLITGPVGSQVLLGVRREGRGTALVTLTRRRVPVHSVTDVQMLDEQTKVGYLRLKKFAEASSEEMDKALWTLHREGMQSLVIDLRGNPGGLLTTAIEISNKFLPCGTIVSTHGRLELDESVERATYQRTWKMPLVVIVDGDSASASEIFAAAIQDNQRGLVVGRRSYGKGTVQTHFPLQTVSGNLKLTTAKFYSPSGREMAGQGVEPDVPVQVVHAGFEDTFGIDNFEDDADIAAAVETAKSSRLQQMATAASRCSTETGTIWRVNTR